MAAGGGGVAKRIRRATWGRLKAPVGKQEPGGARAEKRAGQPPRDPGGKAHKPKGCPGVDGVSSIVYAFNGTAQQGSLPKLCFLCSFWNGDQSPDIMPGSCILLVIMNHM